MRVEARLGGVRAAERAGVAQGELAWVDARMAMVVEPLWDGDFFFLI